MSALPKGWLTADAVCVLALGWLYGGDLLDALRAPTAPVAAMSALPSPGFPALALAALAAAAVGAVVGVVRRRGAEFRGYRLLPVVALVVFFVDFFAVFGRGDPLGRAERVALSLRHLAEQAASLASVEAVPPARAVEPLLEGLPPPPYLVKGEPLARWTWEARTGCAGPATEVAGLPAGTIVYCVAADRKLAWFTAVGLPLGRRFGEPGLVSQGPDALSTVVSAAPAPEADEEGAPFDGEDAGAP
ncbi:MAG: hypothetical protein K1X89_11740 [Myxococcaceae bacterium]|nr:hypothetical protein [Myxococcaceae bacterium]